MKGFRFAILVCFFFQFGISLSQTIVKTVEPNDESVIDPVFNLKEKDANKAITFNILAGVRGDYSIYLEHRINQLISAEFGVGVTTHDYLWSVFNSDYTVFQVDRISDYNPNLSLSAGIRFYGDQVFRGFYVAPQIIYRNYTMPGPSSANNPIIKRRNTVTRVAFGISSLSSGRFYVDGGLAVGYANNLHENLQAFKWESNRQVTIHADFYFRLGVLLK